MIEQTANQTASKPRQILTMVKNERMGGYVPKYSKPETVQQHISQNLELASHGIDPQSQSFEAALAYSADNASYRTYMKEQNEFGFGDLVDMVNPLHHVPVVGALYREISGDDIKPISQIIGGGVFGGPIGAASGLVNTVVEEETGKDIAENAMAFVMEGKQPSRREQPLSEKPEQRLEDAAKIVQTEPEDLPAALLSFTNNGANTSKFRAETFAHYKNLHRNAMNNLAQKTNTATIDQMPELPPREDITKLSALSMPPRG